MIKRVDLAKRFNAKMGFQNYEQSRYKLRKKPRKTWRFSDSNHEILIQEYQCTICRKGFSKIKALNAHMKHHSDREIPHYHMEKVNDKGFRGDDEKCLKAKQPRTKRYQIVDSSAVSDFDSCSFDDDDDDDEKCLNFTKAKKPRTKRYKIVDTSTVSDFNSCSFDDNDDGDIKIDHDAEEAAMVLIMLSRGVWVFGDIGLVMEPCVGAATLLNQEVVNDEDELVKDSVNKNKKAQIEVPDPELEESCDMLDDSCKKDEYRCRTCNKYFSSYQALGGHRSRQHRIVKNAGVSKSKIKPCKRVKDTRNSKNVETSDEKLKSSASNGSSCQVKMGNGSECLICFKVFGSGQALGGHMKAHYHSEEQHSDDDKKLNGFYGNCDFGCKKLMLFGSVNKHEQLAALVS